MPRKKTETAKQNGNSAKLGFEEKLWQAADKQRGHMEAAEYKHVFLGLMSITSALPTNSRKPSKTIPSAIEARQAFLPKSL
ncbi:MAG: hypothetical protein BRC50_04910 [Cyanobacteria bacterium SW_11_48_12]|nr:MAG: hypothetical protein BRC50_04910 [Cyanobacteria bacterium SW_11_48_12]